ncbi:hypothetical protein [Zooshikella sp. RANM57]|uniref:hypothetical protein n=1 Tax=Zooshikella sp. RANM57 TaxID=3425863 RepID=UPI003D6E23CB
MTTEHIIHRTPIFSDDWWSALENFAEPKLFKDSFNPADFMFNDENFLDFLRCRASVDQHQLPEHDNFLRVFVDGGFRYKEKAEILKHPPENGEKLKHYCDRIFDGKEYMILANSVEQFLPNLHKKLIALNIYDRVLPKLQLKTEQSLHINCTIFMGNYSMTPLGIHRDDDFLRGGIHFHLGPGPKVMHLWPTEVYIKNTGSAFRSFELSHRLLATPEHKCFTLEAGDSFYLPQNIYASGPYHVGCPQGFSMAMTLGFFYENAQETLQHALLNLVSDRPEFDQLKNEAMCLYLEMLREHQGFSSVM